MAKEVSKLTRAAKKAAAKRKSLKKAASKQARPYPDGQEGLLEKRNRWGAGRWQRKQRK